MMLGNSKMWIVVIIGVLCINCTEQKQESNPNPNSSLIQNSEYGRFGFSFKFDERLESESSEAQDSICWFKFQSLEIYLEVDKYDDYAYLFDVNSPTIYEDFCEYLDFDSLIFIGSNSRYAMTSVVMGMYFDEFHPENIILTLICPDLISNSFCVLEIYGKEEDYYNMLKIFDSFEKR